MTSCAFAPRAIISLKEPFLGALDGSDVVGVVGEGLEGATLMVADMDWFNLGRLGASEGCFARAVVERDVVDGRPFGVEAVRWLVGVVDSWRPLIESELVR